MSALDEVRGRLLQQYDISRQKERNRSVRETVDLFHELSRHVRPSLTLEVGAFQAYFSKRCCTELPDATVIAFEANPYTWAHFMPDLAFERVDYQHMAATRVDGPVTFQVQRRRPGLKNMTPVRGDKALNRRNQKNVEYEEVTVPGRSLDSYLSERGLLGVPSIMWVDVEGAQGAVLAGASETFRAAQLVLIEMEERQFWSGQLLEAEVDEQLSALDLTPIYMDFEYPGQHNVLYASQAWAQDMIVRSIVAKKAGVWA